MCEKMLRKVTLGDLELQIWNHGMWIEGLTDNGEERFSKWIDFDDSVRSIK